MKKVSLMAAVLAIVLAAVVACTPKFPTGGQLTATNDTPWVALQWPAAAPFSLNDPIAEYRIDVNGVEVNRVDPWFSGCVLKGLANNTDYTISVTAYDTAGRWSGNAAANGRLSVLHHTQASGNSGPSLFCDTAPPDTSTSSTTTTTIGGD